MENRIIKDIRYYENKPENYSGKYDGILGNVYRNSPDTKYIGQRIARKLNEFGFISGIFDHIYINLSSSLNNNDISESDKFLDKRIKYFNYGLKPSSFNELTEEEREKKIKQITFKVLNWIYKNDIERIQLIEDVKSLTAKFDKHLTIKYKRKETSKYTIDLSFQIQPENDKSKLIVEYTNKNDNSKLQEFLNILDYEDLYSLIDKMTVKDGLIIFQSKKSYHAELVAKKYIDFQKKITIDKMSKK